MNQLKGKLHLTFEQRRNKTRLVRNFQQPPLRASHALYLDETERAHVYLVETSGGLVSGDANEYHIHVKEGSSVCLIPQSATKVYPATDRKWTNQIIQMEIEENAKLEWKPETLIPFQSALFHSHTVVRMKRSSSLLFGEILSSGREKSGESYEYDEIKLFMEVWVDENCAVYDRFHFAPNQGPASTIGLLDSHTYVGSLWYIDPTASSLDLAFFHSLLVQNKDTIAGITALADYGIHIRWLSSDLCLLKKEIEKLTTAIRDNTR